jgi:hypothetical protein
MARKPRIHIPGGVYHVMLRGKGSEDIFFSDEDYIPPPLSVVAGRNKAIPLLCARILLHDQTPSPGSAGERYSPLSSYAKPLLPLHPMD